MKMRLMMVSMFYFTCPNALINFMVTLFIRCKLNINNFIQVPASLVFTTISKFCFSQFSRLTKYKLVTSPTRTFD